MKFLAASTLALGLSLAAMSASQAMPLAPLAQASSGEIIHVSGGCGYLRPSRPLWRLPPIYNCPPGWHSGPYGQRCFRNWSSRQGQGSRDRSLPFHLRLCSAFAVW